MPTDQDTIQTRGPSMGPVMIRAETIAVPAKTRMTIAVLDEALTLATGADFNPALILATDADLSLAPTRATTAGPATNIN